MRDPQSQRPSPAPMLATAAAVCPYLLSADGTWRAASPAREHRCTAVAPAAVLATEKQRRLCLVDQHPTCSTYVAATGATGQRTGAVADGAASRQHWTFAQTTPMVLDHGRMGISMPSLRAERSAGQGGLVALMALAFGALIVARLSAGGPGLTPGQIAGAGDQPSASVAPAVSAVPEGTPDVPPARTLVPTEVEPTPEPSPDAAPATDRPPTPTPSATGPQTYTVRSGDTLSGIAGEFGTTWQVLAELNDLDDPGRLRVGQVLDLP